jgi:hypothetical protein
MAQHKLYFGAGLVWCKECSAVATSEKTFTMLRRPCKAKDTNWALPAGSKSRLIRLLQGKHPHGAPRWPDGRDGKQSIKFQEMASTKMEVTDAAAATAEARRRHNAKRVIDMSEGAIRQLRRRIGASSSIVDRISAEHSDKVAQRCEEVANRFSQTDEVDDTPLRTLKLQRCIVAQGVTNWMQSEACDELREKLCERMANFEDKLATATSGWDTQQLVRR